MLGTEGLVVDLRSGLDEVLKVGSQKKVSQMDEFALVLVLDVDDTPSVLATSDLLAVDNDRFLGTNNGERYETLLRLMSEDQGDKFNAD